MHETHTQVTADGSKHAVAREPGNQSTNENFFAHVMQCADVDHLRPLVIDPEAPWMGAFGQAAGASDAPLPSAARAAPRFPCSAGPRKNRCSRGTLRAEV
jgi:hypothetical protein